MLLQSPRACSCHLWLQDAPPRLLAASIFNKQHHPYGVCTWGQFKGDFGALTQSAQSVAAVLAGSIIHHDCLTFINDMARSIASFEPPQHHQQEESATRAGEAASKLQGPAVLVKLAGHACVLACPYAAFLSGCDSVRAERSQL